MEWPEEEQDFAARLPVRNDLNFIFVSFDALRPDALGCMGNPRRVSPNIDAFASRSIVFENAYTASPVTPTSFAAAFTGMYPSRVFKDWKLQEQRTLARVFQEAGYETAAILNNAQLSPARNFHHGWKTYDYHLMSDDELILERAAVWLRENYEKRFLLWVHFVSPHAPYDYRPLAEHLYDPDYSGPFEESSGMHFDDAQPDDLAQIKRLYEGEVFYLDDLFHRLTSTLSELGLLDDSVIVLTSDHGEEFLEHGGFQHAKLYEETLRIPIIVYHPDLGEGLRTRLPFMNVDFLPTMAAIAGIPLAGPLDGINLLRGERRDRVIALSYTGKDYHGMSMRRGSYKIILETRPDRTERLFNLKIDEKVDLSESLPDVSKALATEVWELLGGEEALRMGQFTDPMQGLSDETLKALRALGYIGAGEEK